MSDTNIPFFMYEYNNKIILTSVAVYFFQMISGSIKILIGGENSTTVPRSCFVGWTIWLQKRLSYSMQQIQIFLLQLSWAILRMDFFHKVLRWHWLKAVLDKEILRQSHCKIMHTSNESVVTISLLRYVFIYTLVTRFITFIVSIKSV